MPKLVHLRCLSSIKTASDEFPVHQQDGSSSREEKAQRQQHIIIGPWGHTINETPEGRDFGPAAATNVDQLTVRWFDRWLNGKDNGIERLPYLQLFVMGANRWREADDWPLRETQWTKYYLHSGGSANTAAGDGSLKTKEPQSEREKR